MKALLAAAAVLGLLTACESTGKGDAEKQDEQITRLKIQWDNEKNKMVGLCNEVTRRLMDMEKRMNSQEALVSVYEVDIKRLRAEVDALRTAAAGGAKVGPDVKPDVTTPQVPTQEALMRVGMAIDALKKGGSPDDAVTEVRPVAGIAAPRFMEAIGTHATDPDMVKRLEAVLVKLPAADLKVPLEIGLKDGTRRVSCARVIGMVGDHGLAKLLELYTADADDYFCYEVGRAMLACKHRLGVPPLLRVLRAKDELHRMLACSELSRLNKRDPLGYDYKKTPAENGAAIKAWEEWWDKNGPRLFE
jgi:hypothetical protein